jgi:hypothetical protein
METNRAGGGRHRLSDGLPSIEAMRQNLADPIVIDPPDAERHPWNDPGHDVRADVERWSWVMKMLPRPERPEVRVGSEQIVRDMAEDSGIEMRDTGPDDPWHGTTALLGIPIHVDDRLPENVIIVGTRVMMRRQDGTWITFPLSSLEVDPRLWSPVHPINGDDGR